MKSSVNDMTLVEIVGVAGSGKSSVISALDETTYISAPFISARDPRHLMLVARAIPELSRLLVRNLTRTPRMTWADFKLMAYIASWRTFLRNRQEYSGRPVVFDQGPLYALARLEAKGLGVASTPAFRRWWETKISMWADEMSLVVWLDATDAQLFNRINERSQDHIIKGSPFPEAVQFLDHYRSVFAEVIGRVEQSRNVKVVHVDTSEMKPDEVVARIRSLIDQLPRDV